MSAADVSSASAPALIPRFVRNLNAWAEGRGLTVSVSVEPYSNDPELRLWSNWKGTKNQLLSLGLFAPSHHLPLNRGRLTVPNRERPWCSPLLTGDITLSGEQVLWEIDCGPPDFTITERGDVEIVSYADETVFHGTARDLIDAAVCPSSRLPMGKRTGRGDRTPCHEDRGPSWFARRQLDGTFLYRLETHASLVRRLRAYELYCNEHRPKFGFPPLRTTPPKPTHLRLVVDNARRDGESAS